MFICFQLVLMIQNYEVIIFLIEKVESKLNPAKMFYILDFSAIFDTIQTFKE